MERQKISTKLHLLLKENTNNTLLQLFRYTFVGGLAFIVDVGLLTILTEIFDIYYLISAGASFTVGLLVNYFLSINWVFNIRTTEKKSIEFLLFTGIGIIGLGLNEIIIWLLTDIFFIYYIFSKMLTTFIVYFWNFFARKMLLFNIK